MEPIILNPTFISFLCLTLLLQFTTSQDLHDVYLNSNCSDNSQFEQGGEYQTNLHYLLSNLTSNSGTQKFYNFTSGENPNTTIYGLFLCNIAADNQLCQDCIQTAANGILQTCPSSVEAIVWYALCMLRYSNRSIFSINDVSIYIPMTEGPAEYGQFDQQVSNAFISLFDVAASDGNSSLTSASTASQLGNVMLTTSVECTPDLSPSDCRSCLRTALGRLQTNGHQAGTLLQPSCRLSYSIFILHLSLLQVIFTPSISFCLLRFNFCTFINV